MEEGYFFSHRGLSGIRGRQVRSVPLSTFPFPSYAPIRIDDDDSLVPWITLLARKNGVYDICLVQAETRGLGCF